MKSSWILYKKIKFYSIIWVIKFHENFAFHTHHFNICSELLLNLWFVKNDFNDLRHTILCIYWFLLTYIKMYIIEKLF